MKKTINFSDFADAFGHHDRMGQFSYGGLRAIYDYLIELEADAGEEIELDVIAICCDYTEYTSLAECLAEYSDQKIENLEKLQDNTTVLTGYDGDKIIIQQF